MIITNVQIKLVEQHSPGDKLRAYATVTFDGGFAVRDIRVLVNETGFFLAMPSRKHTGPCPHCRVKNDLMALFCNQCGGQLAPPQILTGEGRIKLHSDIAHPITPEFRKVMQDAVVAAYEQECARLGNRPVREADVF